MRQTQHDLGKAVVKIPSPNFVVTESLPAGGQHLAIFHVFDKQVSELSEFATLVGEVRRKRMTAQPREASA